jgi:hypothetical protein
MSHGIDATRRRYHGVGSGSAASRKPFGTLDTDRESGTPNRSGQMAGFTQVGTPLCTSSG